MIAIGHLLGALRLLCQPPLGCAGLVCINGFARFGAGPDFPEGVAPRLLDRMLRQLVAQPQAVLRDFRARCGDDTPSGAPDMAALERGAGAARRGPARRTGGAAHAGAGAGRRRGSVVPPAMTGAALPGVALRWHARGGHLLPRSDPQWCAGHIRDFALGLAGIGA